MNRHSTLFFLAVVGVLWTAALPAAAQVPLAPKSASLRLGLEGYSQPTLEVGVALPAATPHLGEGVSLAPSPILALRLDGGSLGVGLGIGVQGGLALSDDGDVFVLGTALVMPMVFARAPVVAGGLMRLMAVVGWKIDDVTVTAGPRLTPVVSLDRPVDGRVGIDGVVGVGWSLKSLTALPLTATVDVAGGYDLAVHGSAAGLGAVSGAAMLGVMAALP